LSPGVVRVLSERVPTAAPAPAGGLERRIEALGTVEDSHLRATARLGEVELTVGDLASLNVGDVIQLDTRTNEPVKLELAGTGTVLDASLGTIAGQPALQIRGRAGSGDRNQVTEGR
jgi:flagellar motor switch protein FliM